MRFRCFKRALVFAAVLTARTQGGIPLWDEGLWAEKAGALYLAAGDQVGTSVSLRCYALSWSYNPAYGFASVRVGAVRANERAGLMHFSCESPDIVIRIHPRDEVLAPTDYAFLP
jgi:hypothetical protein